MSGGATAVRASAIDRIVDLYRTSSDERSVAALLVANLIPLVGVMFFGWSLATILVIYWLENGIVGFWNVPRMALAGRGAAPDRAFADAGSTAGGLPAPVDTPVRTPVNTSVRAPGQAPVRVPVRPLLGQGGSAAVLIPFFLVHYGMFWFVHGVFVFVLTTGFVSSAGPFGDGGSGSVSTGPDIAQVTLAAIALFISHGLSFFLDYVRGGEYRTTSIAVEMFRPYGRLVVLHITILLGAFVTFAIGSPLGLLIVLVSLKTALDLALHARHHRAPTDPGTAPSLA